ncbi:OLC1v1038115C1 [Oldenlandia corymbosa var. corymbosa]|uniref:OLC1v1038115C1 n=1 Tax=Oldenlandia corymbosa var. corymbosa TaxID=529605 RepID=A0AAV1D099_OLDCO|nr:OLC1v1038115C1 [Oldenlandia corymbosa var. corymbosa]
MDWYSWLSKCNLEPSISYEYGLAFTRNELEKDDLVYFNHEFLKSLGINVAKHRLEILKLVRKELGGSQNGLSKLVLAFNKTKKLFTRKVGRWAFHQSKNSTQSEMISTTDLCAYPSHWSGALRRLSSSKEDYKPAVITTSNKNVMMKSGPLDRRVMQQERMLMNNRCLSISGPLDGKLQDKWMLANLSPMRTSTNGIPDGKGRERFGFATRSPTLTTTTTPWDGRGLSPILNHYYERKVGCVDDGPSLWSLMFQDLKPT